MTVTYYDPKWATPILTVGPNEDMSDILKLDEYGRPVRWCKTDRNLSSNDESGYKEKNSKIYKFMGQYLSLLSPADGEKLTSGEKYSIKWTRSTTIGSEGVDLLFYNGTTWSTIATVTDPNQTSYLWTVPDVVVTGCIVKVQNHSNTAEYAQCEPFSINNYLTVTQPAAGAFWWTGKRNILPWNTPHNIQWITNGGSDVNVRITYFNGTSWCNIVESTPNDGAYEWVTVTGQECNNGLSCIRVSDVTTGTITGQSELFYLSTNHGYVRRLSGAQ